MILSVVSANIPLDFHVPAPDYRSSHHPNPPTLFNRISNPLSSNDLLSFILSFYTATQSTLFLFLSAIGSLNQTVFYVISLS